MDVLLGEGPHYKHCIVGGGGHTKNGNIVGGLR